MNSQKKQERFYLLKFKELCPDFPDGEIKDSESPDFLVHSSDGVVGIELTTVYRPNPIDGQFPLPAVEKSRDEIVEKIKEYYISQGGAPLEVSMRFSGNVTHKNNIKDEDLQRVARLIKRSRPDIGSTISLDNDLQNDESLPDWIASISIFRFNQDDENFWTASTTAWIPTLSVKEIKNKIDKKDQKYLSYRKKCSSVWLVLMTQVGGGLGTHVKLSTDVWSTSYKTSFDQVWIFQNPVLPRKLAVIKHKSERD